jgi:hypothetical protein
MRHEEPAMRRVQPTAVGPEAYSWIIENNGPITKKFTVDPTRAILN